MSIEETKSKLPMRMPYVFCFHFFFFFLNHVFTKLHVRVEAVMWKMSTFNWLMPLSRKQWALAIEQRKYFAWLLGWRFVHTWQFACVFFLGHMHCLLLLKSLMSGFKQARFILCGEKVSRALSSHHYQVSEPQNWGAWKTDTQLFTLSYLRWCQYDQWHCALIIFHYS